MPITKENLEKLAHNMTSNLWSAVDILAIISDGDYEGDEDDFLEYCQERIEETDISYYSKAMDYLSEYDPSLEESLELAYNLGFDLQGLTSETLATLLYQQKLTDELHDIDLSKFFED